MASGGQLSVKDLKSRLDDNELDLSMMELSYVPVKELNSLRKATILDLSVNRLVTLPADFASLSHLVKLDLSQNRLQILPDNFGDLSSLQHLDLYKNKLETLPVSFFKLKQLKWLDLKDNPIRPELQKIAGDCLDEKQCRLCATRVVSQMQKVESERERERQKKLEEERREQSKRQAAENAEKEAEKKEQQAAKKRDKERRKQERSKAKQTREIDENSRPNMNSNAQNRSTEKVKDLRPKTNKMSFNSKLVSLFFFLLTLLFNLFLGVLFFTMIIAVLLYHNCSNNRLWIPNSSGLCQDLYMFGATGKVPNSAMGNLKLAGDGTIDLVGQRFIFYWETVKQADYAGMAQTVGNGTIYVAHTGWTSTKDMVISVQKWLYREGMPLVTDFSKTTKKYSLIVWEQTKVGARWAANQAFYATKWAIEQTALAVNFVATKTQDIYENRHNLTEKLKFYWNNMK